MARERTITMERRFFVVNQAGQSEFDYLLGLLGIPEAKHKGIDEVDFDVDLDSVGADLE